jgi:hypothetical protein
VPSVIVAQVDDNFVDAQTPLQRFLDCQRRIHAGKLAFGQIVRGVEPGVAHDASLKDGPVVKSWPC